MAETDRRKWDARHLKNPGGSEPSPILKQYWTYATVGDALDIACGNGRNSFFLAENGFTVDGVDISGVATDRLKGQHPQVNAICADLDSWDIPQNRYDLIANIRFLDRRLFPQIQGGLKPGGVLVFESFLGRHREAYCLEHNELLRAFHAFRVVYYEERKTTRAGRFDQTASLVAIKPNPVNPCKEADGGC